MPSFPLQGGVEVGTSDRVSGETRSLVITGLVPVISIV